MTDKEGVKMNDYLKRALEYIHNTGGAPTVAMFDEDHEPIGPELRRDLLANDLITIEDGVIRAKP